MLRVQAWLGAYDGDHGSGAFYELENDLHAKDDGRGLLIPMTTALQACSRCWARFEACAEGTIEQEMLMRVEYRCLHRELFGDVMSVLGYAVMEVGWW